MRRSDLKNFEPSFELVFSKTENEILGITDAHELLANHIFFIKNNKFLLRFLTAEAKNDLCLLVDKKLFSSLDEEKKAELNSRATLLGTVESVDLAISRLSKPFFDKKYAGINDIVDGRQMGSASVHPTAWIGQGVFIGEAVSIAANVKIHPGVVIMSGVQIGESTEIFSNVTLYRDVIIGSNVRIHANSTIGADGFGYNYAAGVHHKVWHMGSVKIEDDVEIGANSCVDSGTFSRTIIGKGTKIDNQVQVGHNCRLGMGVILCGQVAIGGSTTLGDFTVVGGAGKIGNGLTLGRGVQVSGGSAVSNDVADGATVGGYPARDMKEWLKGLAYLRKMSLGNTKKD